MPSSFIWFEITKDVWKSICAAGPLWIGEYADFISENLREKFKTRRAPAVVAPIKMDPLVEAKA